VNLPVKKLLVLDLDETLVHASESRLAREEDFRVGPYYVYLRPHLSEFVASMLATFRVAVWTASGEHYATQVIDRAFPHGSLEFIWSSRRCTTARDWTTGEYQTLKNLRKLKAKGYALESVIAVDDTPAKYSRSYGNVVTVREYLGSKDDDELLLLSTYLQELAKVPNVRVVEKRRWRTQVQGGGYVASIRA
jgi:carboxy-terminal domain RNA polymerase II polypeptide A small phosphatase